MSRVGDEDRGWVGLGSTEEEEETAGGPGCGSPLEQAFQIAASLPPCWIYQLLREQQWQDLALTLQGKGPLCQAWGCRLWATKGPPVGATGQLLITWRAASLHGAA